MATLKTISAALKLIDSKKENLKKAFDDLQSHSSLLSSFSLTWSELDSHFTSLQNSLNQRFQHLESLELQKQAESTQPNPSTDPSSSQAPNAQTTQKVPPFSSKTPTQMTKTRVDQDGDVGSGQIVKPRPELKAFCEISNTGISDAVPPSFWNLTSQLTYLNISHNQIYGEIPHIPMMLYFSTIIIDMSSNHFTGPLPCISSNVTFLDLSNNSLSGSISHFLCYKMNEPKNMQFLNLGNHLLLGKLSNCWMMWKRLSALNLGKNNFTDKIPASIGSLVSLSYLHLDNNRFSRKLPSSLKNCKELVTINVAKNDFVGSIPSWIGHRLSSLVILNLHSNNFHGYIPEELCSLTSLQILDLSHNKLFGSIPKCVHNFSAMATSNSSDYPFQLFNPVTGYNSQPLESQSIVIKGKDLEYSTTLQLVKIIDLSNNNLLGEIPEEVTRLRGLQSLNLSFNILTGKIPKKIGDLGSVQSVDFSSNQLSGQIPLSMSSLTFLSQLNLSNNNLIGRIPSSTQLQSLNASNFFGNKLCGPPLTVNCTIKDVQPNTDNKGSSGGREVDWFYVSLTLGFVVGFWVVWGPLLMNKQWRIMYFQFLDRMGYKLGMFWHKLDSFYLNVVRFLSCY